MLLPPLSLDILALVGLTLGVAFGLGQLLRRVGVPQVVGYITAGVLLGPSLLHLIPGELNDSLTFISEIALGLIGFEMGGHLRLSELREMSGSILLIVLCEAFGAFALVALGVYALTGQPHTALIFGALASATDPASTVDVLAEYHARGPLTTRLLAVVGLDDAVSLFLFSIAASLAESLLRRSGPVSLLTMLELPFYEIGGALLVGVALGFGLHFVLAALRLDPHQHDAMVIPIGIIFLCAGLARIFGFSLTLTTMVLGAVVVNFDPEDGAYIRSTIERAGPVIYVLFFALAGARLRVDLLPAMGLLGVIYLLLRGSGKFGGAWLGSRFSRTEPAVRDNLGLALLAQAGVVIGLALSSGSRFAAFGEEGAALGGLIISVITATTLVAQLVGPLGVKIAVTRAGEAGGAIEALFVD